MLPMPSTYSINAGPFQNATPFFKRSFEFSSPGNGIGILYDMKTGLDPKDLFFSTLKVTVDYSSEISVIFEQTKRQYGKESFLKRGIKFHAKTIFRMGSNEGVNPSGYAFSRIFLSPLTNYHFRLQGDAFIINRSTVDLTAFKIYSYVQDVFSKEEPAVNAYEGGFPIWQLNSDHTYRLEVGQDSLPNICLMEFYTLPQAKV